MATEKTTAVERVWEWETPYGLVKLGIDTVRAYFCPKATDPEIMHFLAVCKYHALNPWLREAYLIKYEDGEAAKIAIGKDAHARKAEEHDQYAGDQGGIIVLNSEGKLEEREGEFYMEDETLLGGWCKVYRKDRNTPIIVRVKLKEWVQTKKDGTPNRFWKGSPGHMIAKVAKSQAQHAAFPGKYSGTMSEEEAQSGPRAEEPITITMPQSNAEAAAGTPESPAAPAPSPVKGNGADVQAVPSEETHTPPAGNVSPNADIEAEARAREQAEARQEQAPPTPATVRIDRGKIWNALLRKAKDENKNAVAVLKELTGRSGMSELDDAQVLELGRKLNLG